MLPSHHFLRSHRVWIPSQPTFHVPTLSRDCSIQKHKRNDVRCLDSRYVPNVVLVRQARDHVLGQHAHHLGSICAGAILVDALPLSDPRLGRVAHSDEALVDV